jgi:hypothetical protein
VVESSALLKRRSPKGYRGFESLPHRFPRGLLMRGLGVTLVHNKRPEIRHWPLTCSNERFTTFPPVGGDRAKAFLVRPRV